MEHCPVCNIKFEAFKDIKRLGLVQTQKILCPKCGASLKRNTQPYQAIIVGGFSWLILVCLFVFYALGNINLMLLVGIPKSISLCYLLWGCIQLDKKPLQTDSENV